jgi:hypothetical protein
MRLIRTLKVAKAVSQRAAGRGFAKENKLRQHFFHCVQTYRVNLPILIWRFNRMSDRGFSGSSKFSR